MSSITPTIGRKVYFWSSEQFAAEVGAEPVDPKQAYDATIVFVHPSGNVNLQVVCHAGDSGFVEDCPLRDPSEGDEHGGEEDYATWMPYQVGQAKKDFNEAKTEEAHK